MRPLQLSGQLTHGPLFISRQILLAALGIDHQQIERAIYTPMAPNPLPPRHHQRAWMPRPFGKPLNILIRRVVQNLARCAGLDQPSVA